MSRWPLLSLGELVLIRSGSTPSRAEPANWNGAVPWVSPKDMKAERIAGAKEHLSESLVRDGRVELVPPGAVLIVVRGMILARAVPVARAEIGVAINQDMKALLVSSRLDSGFLTLVLRAREGELLGKVTTAAHGTKKLDTAQLLDTAVPLPPLDEQRRIVDLLDRAAGVRRLRE